MSTKRYFGGGGRNPCISIGCDQIQNKLCLQIKHVPSWNWPPPSPGLQTHHPSGLRTGRGNQSKPVSWTWWWEQEELASIVLVSKELGLFNLLFPLSAVSDVTLRGKSSGNSCNSFLQLRNWQDFSAFSPCLKNHYTKETISAEHITHNRLKQYLKLFFCFLLK